MSSELTRIDVDAEALEGEVSATSVGEPPSTSGRDRQRKWPRWTWQGVLASVTALAGASAVLLHLIGTAVHRAYLSQWGIDTGPFPKSSDWLVILGYYGVWSALATALVDALKNWYFVFLVCTGVVLYVVYLVNPWNPSGAMDKFSDAMSRLPKWVRRGIALFVGGAALFGVAIWIMATLFFVVGIPATVGRSIGEEIVRKEVEDFAQGCEASKRKCIRFLREESTIGEGYLIESSQSHIAFLDVSMQKVRVLLRENLELQPMRMPAVD